MMTFVGSQGYTPLPSGTDGLGISTDLNSVPPGHASVLGTRNPEDGKLQRLQEVRELIRKSVAGRGIYREGVERLAQLAGFTHMWQGDTLAIAGTCVDLEITFDAIEKEKPKDVVLKIFTPESEEHQIDASDVLKSNLEQFPRSSGQVPWHSLEAFAINLEHLGKMDHLSQGINCFEAIDGLYFTFRKIWEEEKKRMGHYQTCDHLNRGELGRPVLNKKKRLGLCLEYWAEKRHLMGTESRQSESNNVQLGHPPKAIDSDDEIVGLWTAVIDCETGYPPLRVSKEWIAPSVWEDAENEDRAANEGSSKVAWVEPPPTMVHLAENLNDANAVELHETEMKITKSPQVRLMVNLEPSVLVPLTVASSVLNSQGLSVTLDDNKFTTYNQALQNLAVDTSRSKDTVSVPPSQRWTKQTRTSDGKGEATSRLHSYILYSAPQIWCYPVHSVTFDHPKQIADLLPKLRQYVLLWTLLRNIVSTVPISSAQVISRTRNSASSTEAQSTGILPHRGGPIKKNNMDPRRAKINTLLRNRSEHALSKATGTSSDPPENDLTIPLPIDVSLSLTSSSPPIPRLDLIWPLSEKSRLSTSGSQAKFGSVSIEIRPNGEIGIPSTAGIPFAESEKGLRGIARVIGLCEDLGLLVEWIMEKLGE